MALFYFQGRQNPAKVVVANIISAHKSAVATYYKWLLVKTSTNLNVDNQNVDKPKRRQTETSTNQNVDKPKRRQTKTSTNRNGDKPKRRQTKTSTNQNVDTLNFGMILMIYCVYYQYPWPKLDNWIKGMGGQLLATARPQLHPLKLWYGLVFADVTIYLRPNPDANTANICPDKIGTFVKQGNQADF